MLDLIRTCVTCEGSMEGKRSHAIYCSKKCKNSSLNPRYKGKYPKTDEQKARLRSQSLYRRYGITSEEWEALFEGQGRKCALCPNTESRGTGWHTDHCHETGKVRGILCHDCNIMLGHAKDDVETLRKAIAYLSK